MTMPILTSSTSVRKENTPCTPLKKNNKVQSTQYSVVSSTTTVENCQEKEKEQLIRNRVELLRERYLLSMGQAMPMAFVRQLLLSLIDGTPWQYYEYAIEETAYAPRPSWRYTMAIVRRLQTTNTPIEDIRKPRVKEQQYTQREYKDNDDVLDAMMARWALEQKGGE